MRSSAVFLGCMVAMTSCGPDDTAEPAELGEVCGELGPFRVLELEPDEALRFEPPLRIGDRVLYLISKLGPVPAGQANAPVLSTTVWSTGPCGESPVELASGITDIFTIDAWPDVPLGCNAETGEVFSLDPSGARAPHVVFTGVPHFTGCGLRWTSHGLLDVEEHDEDLGALRLHPYPDDPYTGTSTPVTLLDPVRLTPGYRGGLNYVGWALQAFDDFALALTADDTLVRVDLEDGAITPLQADVWAFDASREGAFVLWQSAEFTVDDEREPIGPVSLRELATGVDAPLGEVSLVHSRVPARWAEDGVVTLTFGDSFWGPVRLHSLPDLQSLELSPESYLRAKVDDKRWLTTRLSDNRLDLVDLQDGTRRRLLDRGGWVRFVGTDAIDVHQVRPCCVEGTQRDEGPVFRVPFDGSEARKVAARATRFARPLAGDRLITAVDIGQQMLGTLILVDLETQKEQRIDERVHVVSLDMWQATDEDIIAYSVSDGPRSGVYLARLPAATSERQGALVSRDVLELELQPGPDGRPVAQPRFGRAP